MIENTKITISLDQKYENIKKRKRLKKLIMFSVYLVTMLISTLAIVIYSNLNKPTLALPKSGNNEDYLYQEIKFINLKNDNSVETIYAKDFVITKDGQEYKASAFSFVDENDNPFINYEDIETFEEYKLVHNGTSKSLRVYFKVNTYSSDNLYYKGKPIENYTKSIDITTQIVSMILSESMLFCIIFVIACISFQSKEYIKTSEKFQAINENVLKSIDKSKFNITKTFYFSASKSGPSDIEKMMLLVDNKNKKFIFIDYDNLLFKTVDFKDVVNYKLIEKNSTDVSSNLQYSILLDSLYTTTSSNEVCKILKLVFVLNDEENSTIIYDLIKSAVSLSSKKYKQLSQELIDATAFLDIVQNQIPKDKKFVYCKHCNVKNDYESSHCSACGSVLD